MGNVLFFEPNSYHYEVIPGFLYYFILLGYNVDCLIQHHCSYGDEFCKTPSLKKRVNIIYYKENELVNMISVMSKNKTYDLVFCSSFDYVCKGRITSIYNIIKDIVSPSLGIIGCYHSLDNYRNNISENLEHNRIITLSNCSCEGKSFSMVNPNYFTDSAIEHKKNTITKFISIGVSNDVNESRCAFDKVFDSIGELFDVTYIGGKSGFSLWLSQFKKRLFFPIIEQFNIKKYNNERFSPYPRLSKKLQNHIDVLGKIRFEKMFELIESSDFIIANISESFIDDFLNNKTTGSKQLSLGFCKPCIIEKRLASVYGFSDDNAVVYEKGNLHKAIRLAVTMSDFEYERLQSNLRLLQYNVRITSGNNLKKIIDNLK